MSDDPSDRRLFLVGIEVVVEMDTVDIIPIDDLENRVEHRATRRGKARVDPGRLSVATDPLRMSGRHVSRDRPAEVVGRHRSKWIEPHMQLQPTRVRLDNRQGERIVARVVA
jgi:hypothetical protein